MHPGAELSLLDLFLLRVRGVCASAASRSEGTKWKLPRGRQRSCEEVGVDTRGGLAWGALVCQGGDSRGDGVGRGAAQLRLSRVRRCRPRQRWQRLGIAQGAGNTSEEPFLMLPWPPHREQPLGTGSRSLPPDVRGSWGEPGRLRGTRWAAQVGSRAPTCRAVGRGLVPAG